MAQRTARDLTAAGLRLTDIPGTVRVRTADGPEMSLDLDGPSKLVAGVRWEVRNGILHVEGPKHRGSGRGVTVISTSGPGGRSTSVIRSHGGTISVGGQTVIAPGGGQVIVNGKVIAPGGGDDDWGTVTLTVRVPEGTPVQVSDDGAGNYEIGSTRGHLEARLGGGANVSAGDMRSAWIAVRGSGDAEIASVQSALRAEVAGSGDVRVRGGHVDHLRVSVAGSGDVSFMGTAKEADLSVAGSGDICVDTVTGSLRKSVAGSGSIDVRVQPARSEDDFWA